MRVRGMWLALLVMTLWPVVATADDDAAHGAPQGTVRIVAEVVDINAAGVDKLITLPGIGPTMAARIVEFRELHGPFRRVEDLLKVKGIGERSFQKLRPQIIVARPAGHAPRDERG